ncbi:MAG: 30S ribosomal protein S11 [Candidatus Saccharimonadales bacterium]
MAEETTTPTTTEAPATTAASTVTPKPSTSKKKKAKRTVSAGQVHVMATFNNTIVTITDTTGGALASASAGGCGFRGSKKGTAYAAQIAAEKAVTTAKQQYGFSKADVYIKGVGLGREAAVRVLVGANIAVDAIKDVTGVPHGGCRPKKARRV